MPLRCIAAPAAPPIPAVHRPVRAASWLLAGALLLPAAAPRPAMAEKDAAAAADRWSGTYDVTGLTVDQRTGDTRVIRGHVVLTRKGEGWSAAAELETDYPSHGGPVRADVIGRGDGAAKGDGLSGTAHTQLVIQTVPGVDTQFAFIPRTVGPRLVSDWTARLDRGGVLVVELVNRGEEGEAYSPTRTTLRGRRVAMPSERAPTE
jgi:hypothetical protein